MLMESELVLHSGLEQLRKVLQPTVLVNNHAPAFLAAGKTANGGLSPGTGSDKTRYLSVEKIAGDSTMETLLNMYCRLGAVLPVQSVPAFTPKDHGARLEVAETLLEGEPISCFLVGGEKRLCFPQVISSVLRDFDLQEVGQAIKELNVHCPPCSRDQLDALKAANILPYSANSCGLITQTDGQRLCSALLRKAPRVTVSAVQADEKVTLGEEPSQQLVSSSAEALSVYHECFGRCRGRFHGKLYSGKQALCIQCVTCNQFFAPDRFVVHSHQNQETRTCHWGFDAANWRSYVLLGSEYGEDEQKRQELRALKAKFDTSGGSKRKFEVSDLRDSTSADLTKRARTVVEAQASIPVISNHQRLHGVCDSALARAQAQLYEQLLAAKYGPYVSALAPSAATPTKLQTLSAASEVLRLELERQQPQPAQSVAAAEERPSAKQVDEAAVQSDKCKESKITSPQTQNATSHEPPKKFLLHKAQLDEKEDNGKIAERTRTDITRGRDVEAMTLDQLLRVFIEDDEQRRLVRGKIADNQRLIEFRLDQLMVENRVLQQEVAFLRSKQSDLFRHFASVQLAFKDGALV